MLRGFAGVIILSMLYACGTIKPMQPADSSSVASINAALVKRADEYQAESAKWGRTEVWNNIPLIALGAGGVAASAFATGVAKGNWVTGLALVAGAWALGYSTLAPDTKQDAYSSAATQLSCLADKSKRADDSPKSRLDTETTRLVSSVQFLAIKTDVVNALRANVPSTLGDNDKNTVTAADAIVLNAKSVLDAGSAELDARSSIPLTLKSLLYAIDRKAQVAARSKVLTAVDVNNALSSPKIGSTNESGAAGAEPPGGTRSARVAGVDKLSGAVQKYADATNTLGIAANAVANNPVVEGKIYTSTLASFAQCTNDK
ncbi:MAG: hypothetical protein WDN30_00285 [Pararobbsia sp.]